MFSRTSGHQQDSLDGPREAALYPYEATLQWISPSTIRYNSKEESTSPCSRNQLQPAKHDEECIFRSVSFARISEGYSGRGEPLTSHPYYDTLDRSTSPQPRREDHLAEVPRGTIKHPLGASEKMNGKWRKWRSSATDRSAKRRQTPGIRLPDGPDRKRKSSTWNSYWLEELFRER